MLINGINQSEFTYVGLDQRIKKIFHNKLEDNIHIGNTLIISEVVHKNRAFSGTKDCCRITSKKISSTLNFIF